MQQDNLKPLSLASYYGNPVNRRNKGTESANRDHNTPYLCDTGFNLKALWRALQRRNVAAVLWIPKWILPAGARWVLKQHMHRHTASDSDTLEDTWKLFPPPTPPGFRGAANCNPPRLTLGNTVPGGKEQSGKSETLTEELTQKETAGCFTALALQESTTRTLHKVFR